MDIWGSLSLLQAIKKKCGLFVNNLCSGCTQNALIASLYRKLGVNLSETHLFQKI